MGRIMLCDFIGYCKDIRFYFSKWEVIGGFGVGGYYDLIFIYMEIGN